VIQRAEDEVLAMLQANWPIVQRVVNALCKQDRILRSNWSISSPESAAPIIVGNDNARRRNQR
jgi:hypothetical protein